MNHIRSAGFSLIEIIVAIGIMAVVTMFVVPFYLQFAQEAKLTQDATTIYNTAQIAKAKARAGDGGNSASCTQYSGYRLTIGAQSVTTTLCCDAGCSGGGTTSISTNTLASGQTTISSPAAGTSINFARIDGASTDTSIILRNSSISKCQAIQIREVGPITLGDVYGC